jgi:hypothetical protein
MPYLARKSTARDRTSMPFVVEHENGKIAATCKSWAEAVNERNRLNARELFSADATELHPA